MNNNVDAKSTQMLQSKPNSVSIKFVLICRMQYTYVGLCCW